MTQITGDTYYEFGVDIPSIELGNGDYYEFTFQLWLRSENNHDDQRIFEFVDANKEQLDTQIYWTNALIRVIDKMLNLDYFR